MQPIFEKNDFVSVSENSVSEDIFKNGLCLHSDIKNTKEDMDKIISIVRSFFK
jgi:dTDP-4-amino-4,6-dideoxygalactose transaminase